MINVIFQFASILITSLAEGIVAFAKILFSFEQVSGIKEEIIAVAIGIPTIVITLIGLTPVFLKIYRFIAERYADDWE